MSPMDARLAVVLFSPRKPKSGWLIYRGPMPHRFERKQLSFPFIVRVYFVCVINNPVVRHLFIRHERSKVFFCMSLGVLLVLKLKGIVNISADNGYAKYDTESYFYLR